MRFTAFVLAILLNSASAWAFDCSNITLPSTFVICSDPELMKLADERQAAFNQALWGLDPQLGRQLLADQTAWIRSYAAACGVPPDRPPPNPVPVSVIECFQRAGEARIAYLQSYGLAAKSLPPPAFAQRPTNRVGPSFDCRKAEHPLALLICADPDLSRLDLRFGQAYWALFQQVGPAGQPRLRQEDNDFIAQVQKQCGLSQSGEITPEIWQARNCVKNAYEKEREAWIARLTGPAYQEAVRPPELAIALQAQLQKLGFLPATAKIDGVYGEAVRAAILAWQGVNGRPETGFLGNADAAALERTAPQEAEGTTSPAARVTPPAPLPPIGPKQGAPQTPPTAPAQYLPPTPPAAPTATTATPAAPVTTSASFSGSQTEEKALINAVIEAREKYAAAPNDMAKGGVRAWRKEAICQALPSLRVSDWKGVIYSLSSNSDGKGVVEIEIAPDVYLETMNNDFSDISYHTLIDPNSAVFKKLSKMEKGDDVILSGKFFNSDTDCIEEGSLTQEGSITEPEFIFKFSSISAR